MCVWRLEEGVCVVRVGGGAVGGTGVQLPLNNKMGDKVKDNC